MSIFAPAADEQGPGARTLEAEPIHLRVLLEFTGDGTRSPLTDLPALIASAPHRLMFLAGASAVLVSMAWWAAVLVGGRFGWPVPAAPVPPGWAHAVLTQYGMLPMFMFGFLLTVFPRWLAQPALSRRHYVPVFAGVFGGYLLANAGLLDARPLLVAGFVLMLGGWLIGIGVLSAVLLRSRSRDAHAWSCLAALTFGFAGLGAFALYVAGAPPWWALWSIKAGTFGLLLPIYFSVCHRMIPFFSASVVGPGYRMFRPRTSLPAMWVLSLGHLVLDLGGQQSWLWLLDAPLAVFFLRHWIGWQPWKCLRPGLLAALHLASAWLPIAFALFAIQSLTLLVGDVGILGRAPVHALTVGFFGSMLVAMVTRVTQGHSGRPLQMGRIAWSTFILLQVVVCLRIGAELAVDASLWLAIAAAAWLLAFLPWVLRSLWIFMTPRVDGQPG